MEHYFHEVETVLYPIITAQIVFQMILSILNLLDQLAGSGEQKSL
jgi:preprotein translocase subunit SecY